MGWRVLTDGEIALAARIFGPGVADARVTLHCGAGVNPFAALAFRNGNPAITLGGRIYFRDGPPDDFTAPGEDRGLFVHEMTHVWQYRRLGMPRFLLRYADEYLAHGCVAERLYPPCGGRSFAVQTLEAQAELVRLCDAALTGRGALAGSGLFGGL